MPSHLKRLRRHSTAPEAWAQKSRRLNPDFHETHDPKCGDLCALSALAIPYWGAIGGAAGLVTGGIVGLSHRESYWIGVRLPVPAR